MSESKSKMKYRQCDDCQKVFEATKENFHVNLKKPDGTLIFRRKCKKCYNASKRMKNKAENKKKAIRKRVSKYYYEHREECIRKIRESTDKSRKKMEKEILEEFYQMRLKEIDNMVNVFRGY